MTRLLLLALLLALLLGLQYRLWIGEGSLQELNQLDRAVSAQSAEVAMLQARNRGLRAEVVDLQHEGEAVEERARAELGMIKKQETFFLVVKEDIESESESDPDPGSDSAAQE